MKKLFNSMNKFSVLLFPLLVLLILAVLIFAQRVGISYTIGELELPKVPDEVVTARLSVDKLEKECLLIYDSSQISPDYDIGVYHDEMQAILEQLRVGYTNLDLGTQAVPADLSVYKTIVVTIPNIDKLSDDIDRIMAFVTDGGSLMFMCTVDPSVTSRAIYPILGVDDSNYAYVETEGVRFTGGLLIGDEDTFEYVWDEPAATSVNLALERTATIYAEGMGEYKVPIIWTNPVGDGTVLVENHGMAEKMNRGLHAACYSLLQDAFAYPVINANVYILDDFPSPVPMGDATYVRRDYNRDISSFYQSVWWPDLMSLIDDYGVRYTGVVIDDYNDEVVGPFDAAIDTTRFNYFGGMLLDKGGEIGYHGYNHQPLCFSNFKFPDDVDYNAWPSLEEARAAVDVMIASVQDNFEGNIGSCYVPPSNLLSEEGRELLGSYYPTIQTICSVYMKENVQYEQDFEVAEDGIVEFPRIVSGCQLDNYIMWSAMNELTFHYVNSHFMHPDDALDEDRGAAMGWAKMFSNFQNYVKWVTEVTPNLRNFTVTDASTATKTYYSISVKRILEDDKLTLEIENFYNEAQLLVRITGGKTPGAVTGGELVKVTENLYSLVATSPTVVINLN